MTDGSVRDVLSAAAWRTLVLGMVGVSAGLAINVVHPRGVRLEQYAPAAVCGGSLAPPELHLLTPEQASKLCGDQRTLVADVRDSAAFSRGHVAGAVHIPCSGSRADVEHVRSRLAGKDALVVYGDTDEQARQVASDLAARMARPELSISVIAGGWPAWFNAGMACASGPCDDCEGLMSHAPR